MFEVAWVSIRGDFLLSGKYWNVLLISIKEFNWSYLLTFLGGLSLHLNHLIAWCMGISFRHFGTLPIGIVLSNLDSRHLMTSPRTLFGQFWHMSIFGNSRAIWVTCQKKMPSQNQFFLDEGVTGLQSVLGFVDGQICRLYCGTIFWGGATHLGGPVGHRMQNVHFSTHL